MRADEINLVAAERQRILVEYQRRDSEISSNRYLCFAHIFWLS
jgi:hypothetical protein